MRAPERTPLPISDRGLLLKYLTIALWALAFAVFLPLAYHSVIGGALSIVLTVATVTGAAFAAVGLLRRDNLVMEVTGLCLMLAGPIAYAVLVAAVGIVGITQGNTDRIALIFLALLQVEVVGARLAFLVGRRSEVKHDDLPEARA